MMSSSSSRLLSAAAAKSVIIRRGTPIAVSCWNRAVEATQPTSIGHNVVLRFGHTVRIICIKDMPHGKAYTNDVLEVKAGYARNFLIPQKYALYATRQNFQRLNLKDPDKETPEEMRERLAREALNEADQDLKAANILRKYLSNKHVVIYRKIDDMDSVTVPLDRFGVNGRVVKQKLAKQLNIDLEPHEHVCIGEKPLDTAFATLIQDEDQMNQMLHEMGDKETDNEVRKLGDYLVRIWLRGDFLIPLHIKIERKP